MQILNKLVPDRTPIPLTDTYGRPYIIESKNCKYALTCSKYNPNLTVTQTLGVKGYPESYRTVEIANKCVNHGGCVCGSWKYKSNKLLGGYREQAEPEKGKVLSFKIKEV